MESKTTVKYKSEKNTFDAQNAIIKFKEVLTGKELKVEEFLYWIVDFDTRNIFVDSNFGVSHFDFVYEVMKSSAAKAIIEELENIAEKIKKHFKNYEDRGNVSVEEKSLGQFPEETAKLKELLNIVVNLKLKINFIQGQIYKAITIRRGVFIVDDQYLLPKNYLEKINRILAFLLRGEICFYENDKIKNNENLDTYTETVGYISENIAEFLKKYSKASSINNLLTTFLKELNEITVFERNSIADLLRKYISRLQEDLHDYVKLGNAENLVEIVREILDFFDKATNKIRYGFFDLDIDDRLRKEHENFINSTNAVINEFESVNEVYKSKWGYVAAVGLNNTKDRLQIESQVLKVSHAHIESISSGKLRVGLPFVQNNKEIIDKFNDNLGKYIQALINEIVYPKNNKQWTFYMDILSILKNIGKVIIELENSKWIYSFISKIESAIKHIHYAKENIDFFHQYNLNYYNKENLKTIVDDFSELLDVANKKLLENRKIAFDVASEESEDKSSIEIEKKFEIKF